MGEASKRLWVGLVCDIVTGVCGTVGVAGMLGSIILLRLFQNPALEPFMTNDNVHLDRPRKASGLCVPAVRSDAMDKTNVRLKIHVSPCRKCLKLDIPFRKQDATPPASQPSIR